MPNIIKVILWTILSLGMLFIAIMAFWVFLIIMGVIIISRIIYFKLFNKGSLNIQRYHYHYDYDPNKAPYKKDSPQDSSYTTVIDADDQDKEYKIPKIK